MVSILYLQRKTCKKFECNICTGILFFIILVITVQQFISNVKFRQSEQKNMTDFSLFSEKNTSCWLNFRYFDRSKLSNKNVINMKNKVKGWKIQIHKCLH